MATDEKMLEELYELLTLYFEIRQPAGIMHATASKERIEPQLDRVILQKELLARISSLIVGGDKQCLKDITPEVSTGDG